MSQETTRREISELAVSAGFEPAALLAVVKVEGEVVDMRDGIWDGKVDGLVMIRWEGHYFWRHLPESKRLQAQRAGLAHPHFGTVKNTRSMTGRHEMLRRAMAIDEEAALKSISMGVGQVMGANYAMCGYSSVFEMWHDAQTLLGQVRMMLGFIDAANLDDELREVRFAAFARGYNGPSYRVNRYDTKMEQAYREFGGQRSVGNHDPSLVRMGDYRVDLVKQIQRRLIALGYHLREDGDFGTTTRRYVMAFQGENNLKVDGVVGPQTMEALFTVPQGVAISEERATATEADLAGESRIVDAGQTVRRVGTVGAAGVGAAKTAEETGVVEALIDQSETVRSVFDNVQPLIDLAGQYWWVGLVAVLAYMAFKGNTAVKARVGDHRAGKTA